MGLSLTVWHVMNSAVEGGLKAERYPSWWSKSKISRRLPIFGREDFEEQCQYKRYEYMPTH